MRTPSKQISIGYLPHSQSPHLLQQSRPLLNTVVPSSADLTCFAMENILLLPHLKQMYNKFSRSSVCFSSCFIARFTFSLGKSKTGCSKIGSIFISSFFLLYPKINMDKQKVVTKNPKRQERGKKITRDVHEEVKRKNTRG